VCWLVGPGGTIRLSTDGRSWQPVPFPESTRLTGVTATDDKTVTVTTEDGRRFASTDRGTTGLGFPDSIADCSASEVTQEIRAAPF